MANNRPFRSGPTTIANAAGNLLNPPVGSAGVNAGSGNTYILLRHFRVVNKTGAAVNVSLWIGATGASAAGTEFAWSTTPVPANTQPANYLDWNGSLRLDVTDFLTGLASAATALVIDFEGEIGVA